MEQKKTIPMTPFDSLISSEQLQMMKLMLPYMPPGTQKFFAFYIKFLELRHTMQFFQNFHTDYIDLGLSKSPPSPFDLFRDIQPYMNPKDSESLSQLLHLMEILKTMQAMSDTQTPDSSPLSMMMGMLSPEQQSAFAAYSDLFSNLEAQEETNTSPSEPPTSPSKGDQRNESECMDETPGTC